MNTHDIELMKYGVTKSDDYVTGWNDCYAAIKADRQARGEPVAEVVEQNTRYHGYPRAIKHLDETKELLPAGTLLYTAPQPPQQARGEPVAWLRSDELRKLGPPYSDAPLNSKTDSMMLHAKGTQEAAAKYGHDVPVFTTPQPQQQAIGEPVGEVFTLEPLDGSGDVKCHALLTKQLPSGTKLYAAPEPKEQ